MPVVGGFMPVGFSQVGNDAFPIELAVEAVNLGQFVLKFVEIALREATHHDEFPEHSLFLALGELQDGVDAFLLGIADEAASVDDCYLTLWVFGIVAHLVAIKLKLMYELLAVHKVFTTAECDDIYCVALHYLLLSFLKRESTNSRRLKGCRSSAFSPRPM